MNCKLFNGPNLNYLYFIFTLKIGNIPQKTGFFWTSFLRLNISKRTWDHFLIILYFLVIVSMYQMQQSPDPWIVWILKKKNTQRCVIFLYKKLKFIFKSSLALVLIDLNSSSISQNIAKRMLFWMAQTALLYLQYFSCSWGNRAKSEISLRLF